MDVNVEAVSEETLKASYECPCGCHPEVTYQRGGGVQTDGCCCGNQFAVGPDAAKFLEREGHVEKFRHFTAPWNEQLEAAWLLSPR